mmetsp:Transcript_258/g.688  ORF Transcript_258/g.688 Transcript_258/m.688 type:complete len:217 (+) Transcript_258:822-1472(+)
MRGATSPLASSRASANAVACTSSPIRSSPTRQKVADSKASTHWASCDFSTALSGKSPAPASACAGGFPATGSSVMASAASARSCSNCSSIAGEACGAARLSTSQSSADTPPTGTKDRSAPSRAEAPAAANSEAPPAASLSVARNDRSAARPSAHRAKATSAATGARLWINFSKAKRPLAPSARSRATQQPRVLATSATNDRPPAATSPKALASASK